MATCSLTGLNTKALKKGDDEVRELSPTEFRFYSMRFCPFSEKALLYLARKQIKAEVVNLNLAEKPEWYFKKHPQGKTPALEHRGKVVTESAVIPQYLDELFPETSVLPMDPYERAQQRILVEGLSSIGPAFFALFRAKPEERTAKVEAIDKEVANAESLLIGSFFGGDQPGFADYMVYPFYERIALFVSDFPAKQKFPRMAEWFHNMQSRPEVKAVQQPAEHIKMHLESVLQGKPDYDIGL